MWECGFLLLAEGEKALLAEAEDAPQWQGVSICFAGIGGKRYT